MRGPSLKSREKYNTKVIIRFELLYGTVAYLHRFTRAVGTLGSSERVKCGDLHK